MEWPISKRLSSLFLEFNSLQSDMKHDHVFEKKIFGFFLMTSSSVTRIQYKLDVGCGSEWAHPLPHPHPKYPIFPIPHPHPHPKYPIYPIPHPLPHPKYSKFMDAKNVLKFKI